MDGEAASKWSEVVGVVWAAGGKVRVLFDGRPPRQAITYLLKVFIWGLYGGSDPDPTKRAPEV